MGVWVWDSWHSRTAHPAVTHLLLWWPNAWLKPRCQDAANIQWWEELLSVGRQSPGWLSPHPHHLPKCWDSDISWDSFILCSDKKAHMDPVHDVQVWGQAVFQRGENRARAASWAEWLCDGHVIVGLWHSLVWEANIKSSWNFPQMLQISQCLWGPSNHRRPWMEDQLSALRNIALIM